MKVVSIGIVTHGCEDCKMLKKRLVSAFSKFDIEIEFQEVDYTLDEIYAMEICEQYGFDDIPAFEVNGHVFKKGFEIDEVTEVVNGLQDKL